MKRKKRKSRSKADIITGVLYVLFGLIVLATLYGAGRLVYLLMGTTVGNHYYAALAEKYTTESSVDFTSLSAENPEICAWVKLDDTVIDFPIVHTTDNTYYLTHLLSEKKNKLGTPFIDAGNATDFTDRHTVIYGHALKSGAMFGTFWEYENPNYFTRHPSMTLYLPDGRQLTLAVFACARVEGVRSAIPISFSTEAEFLTFIDDLHEVSAFSSSVKVSSSDRIVSFCMISPDGGDERLLVSCKITEDSAMTTITNDTTTTLETETITAEPETTPEG